MITFLTIPRAFTGEFDQLQRDALTSWRKTAPGCQIMLFGDEDGVEDARYDFHATQYSWLRYHAHGSPLVDQVFAKGDKYAFHAWICFTSADIVFDCDFTRVLAALKDIDRPFVIGQRYDLETGDGLRGAVLHPPCGVDYFLYRRGTIGPVLPFTVRGGAGDNWMVWKALTAWQMTVIDATHDITALHRHHSHPEWTNGKAGREGSAEQKHNHALARADGMRGLAGVDAALWVLREGAVMERERVTG